MGSEYPKGGGRYSWGIRPSGGGGDIPRIFVPRWRYSSTFLKILSCPPPPKYEFAPQMPPQIPRPGAATVCYSNCPVTHTWGKYRIQTEEGGCKLDKS